MKKPLAKGVVAMLLVPALALAYAGCGSDKRRVSLATSVASSSLPASVLPLAPSPRLSLARLPQDEDDDDGPGEEKGHDPHDRDIDGDNDHLNPKGYYDLDDSPVRDYGHAAGPADRRALTLLARRYFTAAAADDGAAACSMLTHAYANSLPEDFGRGSAGPAFLRSATTCQQVLTVLFAHLRSEFSAPIEVLRVRVRGKVALVLIGAATLPAAFVEAQRAGDVWRVVAMPPSPIN